jgi:hypothetical protein
MEGKRSGGRIQVVGSGESFDKARPLVKYIAEIAGDHAPASASGEM